jgi:NADPH:quinone reductase-like Zn-dependent oxidoreductase
LRLRNVPADWVVRLPAEVSDDVAAALLLKGLTADYLLHDLARVGPGTRLLVHAAAGGVGLLVCAWARRLGAVVLGTVSSDEKARVAREHGCEHVIVTRDYRFADAVKQALRRRRRRDRRAGRRRARREPRRAGAPRPLDQPGPGGRAVVAAALRMCWSRSR